MTVRTRFAPSPTGHLHIGGVRTALYSWLRAKKNQGQFILRIEDTDRERSTDASVKAILEAMSWLGLDYDEGPYYQTQRMQRYQVMIEQLLDEGKAYHCYCSREMLDKQREQQRSQGLKPKYNRHCRDNPGAARPGVKPVVRFKNPLAGAVEVNDKIKGRVVVDNQELDDLIIARPDGTPTYNFTVVVDDIDMGITDVIRGDDHLNNTPRQINIFMALGADLPTFAHLPMILGSDGSRLSKRHGALNVLEYRDLGYLPEALLNYLVRLGWSHGDQEVFSQPEMIHLFAVADVNRSASAFNPEKLVWLNQHYLKTVDSSRLAEELMPFYRRRQIDCENGPEIESVIEAYRERAETLEDMTTKTTWLYQEFEQYDEKAAKKFLRPVFIEPLRILSGKLAELQQWDAETIHRLVEDTAAEMDMKFGKLGQPLRVAVCGSSSSPSLGVTLELLGRIKTLRRIDRALQFIVKKSQTSA